MLSQYDGGEGVREGSKVNRPSDQGTTRAWGNCGALSARPASKSGFQSKDLLELLEDVIERKHLALGPFSPQRSDLACVRSSRFLSSLEGLDPILSLLLIG